MLKPNEREKDKPTEAETEDEAHRASRKLLEKALRTIDRVFGEGEQAPWAKDASERQDS